jgi:hypothetical protein
MMTIVGSIVHVELGGPTWPCNEHDNLSLDSELDSHMIAKQYEENGYNLDSDLLTICTFHILRDVDKLGKVTN